MKKTILIEIDEEELENLILLKYGHRYPFRIYETSFFKFQDGSYGHGLNVHKGNLDWYDKEIISFLSDGSPRENSLTSILIDMANSNDLEEGHYLLIYRKANE